MLRIGEFARLAGVSIKLLRKYDEVGLLKPRSVDLTTGYRYYSVAQLTQLNRLLVHRSLGFSVKEMQKLTHTGMSSDRMRDMLTQRRADLEAHLATERAKLADLEARIAQIEREGALPPHEVVIRSTPITTAVSLRKQCDSYDEIGDLLRNLRSKLPARTTVTGYGAIWHRCQSSGPLIECEALVFLDARKSSYPDGLRCIQLPACTVASVIHDDSVNAQPAYRAALERARRLGYTVAGPMRERYLGHGVAGGMIDAQFPLRLARPAAHG